MKKQIYSTLCGVLCMSLFYGCNKSDQTITPKSTTYTVSPIETEVINSHHIATTGPVHLKYVVNQTPDYSLNNLYNMIVPQMLRSITLTSDGIVQFEVNSKTLGISDINMGLIEDLSDIEAYNRLIPTTGWYKLPENLFSYSITGTKFTLTANLISWYNYLNSKASNNSMSTLLSLLSSKDPALIRESIKTLTGIDLTRISDETILQLLSWVRDGIPFTMNTVTRSERVQLHLYLTRADLNTFFCVRTIDQETTTDWNELIKILSQKSPSSAFGLSFLFSSIANNWEKTETFELGINVML